LAISLSYITLPSVSATQQDLSVTQSATHASPPVFGRRKTGLPVDYLPWKMKPDDLGTILERGDAAEAPEAEAEAEGDSSDDEAGGTEAIVDRNKNETAEEKKLRKVTPPTRQSPSPARTEGTQHLRSAPPSRGG
jgi:hypothetical protein